MSRTTATVLTRQMESAEAGSRGRVFGAIVECTKPGITRLVTITSLVGFLLAALGVSWTAGELAIALVACVVGTALSAAGANALNQYMERARDALMERTRTRPLPSGRLRASTVLWVGLGLTVAGVGVLWALGGAAPAAVSLATTLTYLLWYTPLKPVSVTSTLVGAIPGALPPLIGWSIARGAAGEGFASIGELGGLSLFALMFVWQLPHFFAIGWMYREHYREGGHRILPVVDSTGRLTSWAILVTAILLIPATVAPVLVMWGTLGWVSAALAVVSGAAYVALCVRFVRDRSERSARMVFFASIIHLPVLLIAMVLEAVCLAWL